MRQVKWEVGKIIGSTKIFPITRFTTKAKLLMKPWQVLGDVLCAVWWPLRFPGWSQMVLC